MSYTVILAVDPGPERTAWVALRGDQILDSKIEDNLDFLSGLHQKDPYGHVMAIEMIASYGMPVGADVFETCVWIGRFVEAWMEAGNTGYRKIYRKDVKLHLCGSPRAKDSNVRQAIIDRFGGKDKAIGKKKSPGPLYGVKADMWAALAVGLTAQDKEAPCHAV